VVPTVGIDPGGANYLVLGLDVLVEVILLGKVAEVLVDFLAAGINTSPVQLGLERPGVVVRWDVAGTSF
jgi:hypothetical protein